MERESDTLLKISLPKEVKHIIDILTQNGYEAYAVGGCVRDSILGRVPGDWDITTSALPQQVKALFRRTIDTGIQHGTVTIMLGKNGYEVTTYRIDGKYEDSRHPESVEFTPNLEEDLKRRDFTINAMAYNDENGVVDIFGAISLIILSAGLGTFVFTDSLSKILYCPSTSPAAIFVPPRSTPILNISPPIYILVLHLLFYLLSTYTFKINLTFTSFFYVESFHHKIIEMSDRGRHVLSCIIHHKKASLIRR